MSCTGVGGKDIDCILRCAYIGSRFLMYAFFIHHQILFRSSLENPAIQI